jgi:hypothetical protein
MAVKRKLSSYAKGDISHESKSVLSVLFLVNYLGDADHRNITGLSFCMWGKDMQPTVCGLHGHWLLSGGPPQLLQDLSSSV